MLSSSLQSLQQLRGGIGIVRYKSTGSASKIFGNARSAEFLAAAASSSSIPNLHGVPEVIVTGRANVGKSTLLNAILGRSKLLRTSKKPGHTKTLNFFRVGPPPGSLIVVDAPGYGSRGRAEWGALFDYYVENRNELKRVYVLLSAKHGLNEMDKMMLQSLNEKCQASGGRHLTMQAVITKADTLTSDAANDIKRMQEEVFEAAPLCLPGIVTTALKQPFFGIDEVRSSIAEACGVGRVESKVVVT